MDRAIFVNTILPPPKNACVECRHLRMEPVFLSFLVFLSYLHNCFTTLTCFPNVSPNTLLFLDIVESNQIIPGMQFILVQRHSCIVAQGVLGMCFIYFFLGIMVQTLSPSIPSLIFLARKCFKSLISIRTIFDTDK